MEWRRCWCVIMAMVWLIMLGPFMLMASSRSIITKFPGYPANLPFNLETGYIGVGEGENVQLFYIFVESQRNPSTDPLLLWLIGGPGCSGLTGLFIENGPFKFDHNYSGNLPTLKSNPYSWTQTMNVIYIDIPVGTGFSYSQTQEGYYSNVTLWVDHNYEFLQKWFIDHPEFLSNPFYIGGGSYSGLPAAPLVLKVYQGYKAGINPLINLQGYVLASPLTDTTMVLNMRIEYAHHMSLISDELYESIKASCNGDVYNIDPKNTKCLSDFEAYTRLVQYVNEELVLDSVCCISVPRYNAREIFEVSPEGILKSMQHNSACWCASYDSILVNQWANLKEVRKALHIREGTKGEFERCNRSQPSFTRDIISVVNYHRNLTDTNLRGLIYSGDLDLEIPHMDTTSWIKSLKLKIHDPWRPWFVDGQAAGYTQMYKKQNHYLTYAAVKGAGHVAHRYKPKEAYQMIYRWLSSSPI